MIRMIIRSTILQHKEDFMFLVNYPLLLLWEHKLISEVSGPIINFPIVSVKFKTLQAELAGNKVFCHLTFTITVYSNPE
jgi:hypothetical protein